jgi:hypothetical protein
MSISGRTSLADDREHTHFSWASTQRERSWRQQASGIGSARLERLLYPGEGWQTHDAELAPQGPEGRARAINSSARAHRTRIESCARTGFAFTGRHAGPMAAYSRMTDLLLGACVWGLLEGCLRNLPGGGASIKDGDERTATLAEEACSRVLGPERMRSVRGQLPQWEGPPARNLSYRRALSRMHRDGVHDGGYLAAGGSSLLCQCEQYPVHAP